MVLRYTVAGILAILGGVAAAVNVESNAIAINGGQWVFNDLTRIVATLAVVGAIASMMSGVLWRLSVLWSVVAVAVFAGATYTSVGFTLDRVGQMQDNRTAAARHHNRRIIETRGGIAAHTATISQQQEIAARECRGYNPPSDPARRTAYDQRWPNCLTARGLIEAAEAKHAAATALLATLGAPKPVDPAGERYAALTGGWLTAERYQISQPFAAAWTLELGVNLLFAAAGLFAAGPRRRTIAPQGQIEPAGQAVTVITPADIAHRALIQAGRPLSNGELAELLGWHETKTSRNIKLLRADNRVISQRDGQRVLITAL